MVAHKDEIFVKFSSGRDPVNLLLDKPRFARRGNWNRDGDIVPDM